MHERFAKGAAASPLAAMLESRYEELHRFALRRSGSAAAADDIMQDAWLRLSGHAGGKAADEEAVQRPLAYLYRVVANLAVDRQRQATAQGRHEVFEAVPEDRAGDAPTPFQVVAGQQEYALLQQAIRELPDKCREVFLLYRGKDLTMQQIAARLGISPRTVENHLARAMLHCRRRLRAAGRGP